MFGDASRADLASFKNSNSLNGRQPADFANPEQFPATFPAMIDSRPEAIARSQAAAEAFDARANAFGPLPASYNAFAGQQQQPWNDPYGPPISSDVQQPSKPARRRR